MVNNNKLHQLKNLGKNLFYLIVLVILTSILLLFIYIPTFIYLHDSYEFYSYYTYNNVTITKVVKLNEVKIYYGRFEKKDIKPSSYYVNSNLEFSKKYLLFDKSKKVYILGHTNFDFIIGKDTNLVILDEYTFNYYCKLNKSNNKNPRKLIINSIGCFYNNYEERFNNGHSFFDDLDTENVNFRYKYSTFDTSKVKREYELGKNNILDKIF